MSALWSVGSVAGHQLRRLEVFDIGGPQRLVMITCAGELRRDRGGYSRNLIVVARPIS